MPAVNPVTIIIIVLALIVLVIFLHFVPMGLWISSLASGVHVSIGSLVGMDPPHSAPAAGLPPDQGQQGRPEPDHFPAGNPLPGRR